MLPAQAAVRKSSPQSVQGIEPGLLRARPRLQSKCRPCAVSCHATTQLTGQVVIDIARRSAHISAVSNAVAYVSQTNLAANMWLWASALVALSSSVGAWTVYLTGIIYKRLEPVAPVREARFLHGVDVTNSLYLGLPQVVKAADFAARAHAGQRRLTGHPYVMHVIETAAIVEGLLASSARSFEVGDMSEQAMIVALLHDVVDDTSATLEEVEAEFGAEIALKVEKVSQLSSLNQLLRRNRRQLLEAGKVPAAKAKLNTEEEDRLRNMVLLMTDEPLVIVVKLADRLHNMRTAYALAPNKRRAVAEETLQIWCSLAERLGMFALKSELEDLCFALLQPECYKKLHEERNQLWKVNVVSPSMAAEAERALAEADRVLDRVLAAESSHAESLTESSHSDLSRPAVSHSLSASGTSVKAEETSSSGAGPLQHKGSRMAHDGRAATTPKFVGNVLPKPEALQTRAPSSSTGWDHASTSSRPVASCDSDAAEQTVSALLHDAADARQTAHSIDRDSSGALSGSGYAPSTSEGQLAGRLGSAEGMREGESKQERESRRGGESKKGVDSRASGEPKSVRRRLTEEQREAQRLLRMVLRFDDTTYRLGGRWRGRSEADLAGLEACAKRLIYEIDVESVATGLDVHVEGRLKSLYSVWNKMRRKETSLPEVYDARALRIIVDDDNGAKKQEAIETCYSLLITVQRLWRKVPSEDDDDYIVNPKPSGYQSLHTAVIGPGGSPLEVQIRTSTMHEVAEYGSAAHWTYKENTPKMPEPSEVGRLKVGQPVMRIQGRKLQLGVVLEWDAKTRRCIVATQVNSRPNPGAPVSLEEVDAILQKVTEKNWGRPGDGDFHVYLEQYAFYKDKKFHLTDVYNARRQVTLTPLFTHKDVQDANHQSAASRSSSETAAATKSRNAAQKKLDKLPVLDGKQQEHKIRLLRDMLEWGKDVKASLDEEDPFPNIVIVTFPIGKLQVYPSGTTAGHVIREQEPGAIVGGDDGDKLMVNVNNALVPEDTPLKSGDYVVTTRELVEI